MKKVIVPLFFLSLPIYCSAEIIYDWAFFDAKKKEVLEKTSPYNEKMKTALLQCEKKDIEKVINAAALRYREETFADLGAYNFFTATKQVTVSFTDRRSMYRALKKPTPTIQFYLNLLKEKEALELIAVHEFSHAYDHVKEYPIEDLFLKTTDPQEEVVLMKKLEARATRKEHLYVLEKKSIPKEINEKLIHCYDKGDYWVAYHLRGAVIRDWLGE